MRDASTYRGARRKEAKAEGLRWGYLDVMVDTSGTRRVQHPFKRGGKAASKEAVDAVRASVLAAPPSPARDDGSRYNGMEMRRLAAERGVGAVSRIHPDVRANFKPTKRKG